VGGCFIGGEELEIMIRFEKNDFKEI